MNQVFMHTMMLKIIIHITNNPIRTSSYLNALYPDAYKFLGMDQIMPYEEFAKSQGVIYHNTATLTYRHSQFADSNVGNYESDVAQIENQPVFDHRRTIRMTDFQPGDVISVFKIGGDERNIELPILHVTDRSLGGGMSDDHASGTLFVAPEKFTTLVQDKLYYVNISIEALPNTNPDLDKELRRLIEEMVS